jgi:isopenicillin-N epimerase
VAAARRDRAESNPHRFNRVELPPLIAAARERAAGFPGLDPSRTAWLRNVSEGVSAVLGSLELRPRDELVTGTHGYGAVAMARHGLERRSPRPPIPPARPGHVVNSRSPRYVIVLMCSRCPP